MGGVVAEEESAYGQKGEIVGQDHAHMVVISSGRPDAGLEVKPQDLLRALEAQVGDFAS
ncbi:MAG: hypothetical protein H8D78_08535 [Chloroflexi bacterium]|nr:hypothetical protein [Chloroflexota bacterium]